MRHPDYDGAEEYEATKAHLMREDTKGVDAEVGHTEGPWEVNDRGPLLGVSPVSEDYVGKVCNMSANLRYPARDPYVEAEMRANARLIAASPDLIDACKEAAQAIVEMEDMDHVQRMEWFETTGLDLYDLLRAAIEKAEGTNQ